MHHAPCSSVFPAIENSWYSPRFLNHDVDYDEYDTLVYESHFSVTRKFPPLSSPKELSYPMNPEYYTPLATTHSANLSAYSHSTH